MSTYVVFNKETGAIVHTHTEASLHGEPISRSPEEVLELSQRILGGMDPNNLDVVRIDQDVLRQSGPDRELFVDLQNRVLADRPTERAE